MLAMFIQWHIAKKLHKHMVNPAMLQWWVVHVKVTST